MIEGDSPQQLDGKELLARAFITAMMSVSNPTQEDLDLGEEIMKTLKQVTEVQRGPFQSGEWLCLNLDTFEVGRAVPFKGEHRIVVPEVSDADLHEAQGQRIAEREGETNA